MTLFVIGILLTVAGIGWLFFDFNRKIEDIRLQIDQINTKLDINGIKSDGRFIEGRFRNGKNDTDEAVCVR